MRFKIDWASLIVGSKFTVFVQAPRGVIFGGVYTWRGLFSEFYGTLSSGSSLVTGRTCAIVPVQQHFFSVPYGISTEAHAWHIGKEHTNLMNSRTPTITYFVEHSTRL